LEAKEVLPRRPWPRSQIGYQSFVATVEGRQRKLDVFELIDFAEAIGFDPREAIKRLLATKRD
jgi:hypothetical protein